MKKRGKKKKRLKILFFSIGIFIVGMLSIILVNKITKLLPVYKIESRIKNIDQYNQKDKNIEAIGWIRVQGTNIDYPVLNNNYDIKVNNIIDDFAWTQGTLDAFPNKLFILGHNIKNVSSNPIIGDKTHTRFEQLLAYIYYDFVKENQYIQYSMDGNDYLYKIFSVSMVDDSTLDYTSSNYTKQKMKEYITQSKEDSYFKFDVAVDENDKIISLITCTRFFGAEADYTFKIDARLVRKNEHISNYNVSKNKNYAMIEKIMRGEEDGQEA